MNYTFFTSVYRYIHIIFFDSFIVLHYGPMLDARFHICSWENSHKNEILR